MSALACGVVACGAAGKAESAPARVRFQIGPQSYAEALIDLAQQANVTLIGASACPGEFRGRLTGEMTIETALGLLLADAPCRWNVLAPGAVEIAPAIRTAEPPKPEPPVTVSELLVTATKRVRDPRALAVAVTAIPRAQVRATAVSDAGEAASQLAGVLTTNLGPGRNKLLLRALSDGAYTGRARSTVATYLDDIPINYNAPDPDLRLADIDRVEVARGPQGALYGAGSISGIYRIVTRKPDLERYAAEVRASGALTESGEPSYALEGALNAPLFGGALGARLSAYTEVQGGYLDNTVLGRKDVDRTERQGGRLSLLFEPSEDWTVGLTLTGQHLRSDDTHYTTENLRKTRQVRIPEPHVNDINLATATVRRSWGWGELTSSAGYVRHNYTSLYDATATQDLYTSFARTSAYSERTRTRMLVQDTVLASRGAGRLEWLAGIYASDARVETPTQLLAQNPGLPDVIVYSDDRMDKIREFAGYGEVAYQVGEAWTVALGARVFNIRSETSSDVNSERFPRRQLERATRFTDVSPKISIQRTLGPGDLVYAVLSEGHRAGGVNTGGALPLQASRESYRPDRLRNYELGLKLDAFERRLAFNSALFFSTWNDIQTDQFRPSGIPYTTNAGDADVLGLESEFAWRGDSGLGLQLNGRLTKTWAKRVNPEFVTELADGLPGAPAVSGGVIVTYDRAAFGDWTLRLLGQAAYVGPSRISFEPSLPKSEGYLRAKLVGELTDGRLGAQVYVTNPFNRAGDTFAFGNPFNPTGERQITPQRPITVGMTLYAAF